MPLLINTRHLENQSLQLQGECTPAELDLQGVDEVITLNEPLRYDLEAQLMEQAILVQGQVELPLDCECVRCLKRFRQTLQLDDWACHIPLEGEEKALLINDCVDLTPYLREDIFLAFPQHPLCDLNCSGLPSPNKKAESGPPPSGESAGGGSGGGGATEGTGEGSPWSVLDKLKL